MLTNSAFSKISTKGTQTLLSFSELLSFHFTLMQQHSTPEAYRQKHKFKVIYRHKPLNASCCRNAELNAFTKMSLC
jgi:hypothetical protein